MAEEKPRAYKFSFGPWNIHSGADPFGPPVREEFAFGEKLKFYKKLGFDGVQFHDDDVVPAEIPYKEMVEGAKQVKEMLDDQGLVAEFVAPRLWEDPRTIDGGPTSNDPKCREYAFDRAKRAIDLGHILEADKIVWWPAREGTYIREAKDPIISLGHIVDFINSMLEYDNEIRILGEMKPNEPMDLSYIPTSGHFIGVAYKTADPARVGVLIESAHCILAGLDPSDEMAYALWHKKLWGVHLNDQDGLKFDEDKAFGSVNLRRAFNQVWVLEKYGYGKNGEFIGLDVKAMRTQKREGSTRHLANSRRMFLALLEVVRKIDEAEIERLRAERDYEALELYILEHLMGIVK